LRLKTSTTSEAGELLYPASIGVMTPELNHFKVGRMCITHPSKLPSALSVLLISIPVESIQKGRERRRHSDIASSFLGDLVSKMFLNLRLGEENLVNLAGRVDDQAVLEHERSELAAGDRRREDVHHPGPHPQPERLSISLQITTQQKYYHAYRPYIKFSSTTCNSQELYICSFSFMCFISSLITLH
jgi:hypothetical protein